MKKYQDHYFLQAKRDNYPARSVYKLKEIDTRYKIFRPGMKVLDLGAAPGSWTLAASEVVSDSGLIISADLQSTQSTFPAFVQFYQEDVFERSEAFERVLLEAGPFDVIMSDMAPRTTGHRATDQARSMNLCEEALNIAHIHLSEGGHFIVKVFMGPDVKAYSEALRRYFSMVKSYKPSSSRSESFETFYIGLGYKKQKTE